MSFSRAQQGIFRPLLQRAWEVHCRRNAGCASDRAARDIWYRGELLAEFGVDSTRDMTQTRDFEQVMAHFESITGDSLTWGLRIFDGDSRRILHEVDKITKKHGWDGDYLRRIARQALRRNDLPELHTLPREELLVIVRAAKIHAKRRKDKVRDLPSRVVVADFPF